MLHTTLPAAELAALASRQANALFPDGHDVLPSDLVAAADGALERVEHCFSHIHDKYFSTGSTVAFDHLHGDQYAMWLYLLSNELYRAGGRPAACKKLFLLNKALHGCDIFYEVALPPVFLLVHPLGTVLGRGSYGDYLLVYQRCTVGSNHGVYPTLGRFATLRPGASVLGACTVGENCTIAAESLLLDRDLAPNSVYAGTPRDHSTRVNGPPAHPWRT